MKLGRCLLSQHMQHSYLINLTHFPLTDERPVLSTVNISPGTFSRVNLDTSPKVYQQETYSSITLSFAFKAALYCSQKLHYWRTKNTLKMLEANVSCRFRLNANLNCNLKMKSLPQNPMKILCHFALQELSLYKFHGFDPCVYPLQCIPVISQKLKE